MPLCEFPNIFVGWRLPTTLPTVWIRATSDKFLLKRKCHCLCATLASSKHAVSIVSAKTSPSWSGQSVTQTRTRGLAGQRLLRVYHGYLYLQVMEAKFLWNIMGANWGDTPRILFKRHEWHETEMIRFMVLWWWFGNKPVRNVRNINPKKMW